jgi:hypothetical protein
LPGREACNAILRWHYYADFQIEIFSKNVPWWFRMCSLCLSVVSWKWFPSLFSCPTALHTAMAIKHAAACGSFKKKTNDSISIIVLIPRSHLLILRKCCSFTYAENPCPHLRASTLMSSDRSSHALIHNTSLMSCLISRLVE